MPYRLTHNRRPWTATEEATCLCGHEYDDHWGGVPSTACDIDGCPCDEYRDHQ